MGGDSFAWYTERVPGTYVRLGTHDPASDGPRLDLHSATFDVDERAIAIGARLLASCALAALAPRRQPAER
jgi:amidohydrolase